MLIANRRNSAKLSGPFPEMDDSEIKLMFIEHTYGKPLAYAIRSPGYRSSALTQPDDLIDALEPVIQVFRELGIQHFIGGSIASSFHGATRSTMDVDVVCNMTEAQVSLFVSCFAKDFYISQTAVENAVRSKSCFNLIHLPTSFKVDVFVSRGRPFDNDSMRRATQETLGTTKTFRVPIATAEDSIISKLEWYRLTNETLERQGNDVTRLTECSQSGELPLDRIG